MTEPSRRDRGRVAPGEPDRATAAGLAPLLERQRLLVCVGSGGVGKTTTAAALGLAAALRGRRVAVLTIDPARRLRDALGIEALDGEPHRVPIEHLWPQALGSLDAMLLDAKRTFDELIRRYAPGDEAAERILANRIYQSISAALGGSQEYMAMERLYALAATDRYELLVVDTPPTHHALDLLQAPERLSALLSSRAAAILQNPALILARGGSRIAQAALAAVLRGLERFTGLDLLRDIADFVGHLEPFSEGFQSRAASVARFLRDDTTSFLLVTSAEPARIAESLAFHRELVQGDLPVGAFIVNRVLPASLVAEPPPDAVFQDESERALARKLSGLHARFAQRVREERAEIARLESVAGETPVVEVPAQTVEPTSLARLAALAAGL